MHTWGELSVEAPLTQRGGTIEHAHAVWRTDEESWIRTQVDGGAERPAAVSVEVTFRSHRPA